MLFQVSHGVMVAMYVNSGGGHPNKLSRLSDVAWLGWKKACEKNKVAPGPTLKHYVHHNVANDDTTKIIYAALAAVGKWPQEWPGHTFSMSSPQGHALLGTANGLSLGRMVGTSL